MQLFAQQFYPISENAEYTEYVLENANLQIAPPFEVLFDVLSANPFQILEQRIVEKNAVLSADQVLGLALSTDSVGVTEVLNPGVTRGKQVASLKIHVARVSDQKTFVTEFCVFELKNRYTQLNSGLNKLLPSTKNHFPPVVGLKSQSRKVEFIN